MSAPATARWGDFLRRYFGVKAGERVNVLADVMPTVNLLEEAPELRWYRNERRWMAYVQAPAGGAGTYSRVNFGLNADAGRITVVERLLASKAANGLVCSSVEAAASIPTRLSANTLDARSTPNNLAVLATETFYNVTAPGTVAGTTRIDVFSLGGGTPGWSPYFPGVVLEPGGPQLVVQDLTANETLDLYVLAYDVPLHGNEET